MANDITSADIDALPPRAAAAAIALGAAGQDPAVARDAALYLRKQVEIADLQIADMRREDQLRHWSVVVHHTSDLLRLALELALAVIVVGFVVAIAAAIWVASHDDSLIIEPFSMPPQMEQSGLTGKAVAAQLQDKLAAMQEATNSSRPAKSYSNSWDDGIKVMIPDTGISIGDLYRTLAGWFGHQVHITGEVYRTKNGISVTARSNGVGGATVSGSEADFDSLLRKSAEAIYRRTQPYRYAVYLATIGKVPQAMPIYQALADKGDREDRLWSHMGISTTYELTKPLQAPAENRKALAIDPDFILAHQNIAGEAYTLGDFETALAEGRKAASLLESGSDQMTARASAISLPANRGWDAFLIGDCQAAKREFATAAGLPDYALIAEVGRMRVAVCLARLHERRDADRAWANIPLTSGINGAAGLYYPYRIETDAAEEDWRTVLADAAVAQAAFHAIYAAIPPIEPGFDVTVERQIAPYAALAKAKLDDIAGAHALIDKSPLDCYPSLLARGRIAMVERKWPVANDWFARAVAQSPSIPYAYADWGEMLMAKGDLDGAIAKFEAAHDKGPHFADPLEMWGEALIAKNRSDLALAKFEEANKYAPNWGRLHLKWAEALLWSGDKTGAQKQFATASHLDLTPSEKSELAKVAHG